MTLMEENQPKIEIPKKKTKKTWIGIIIVILIVIIIAVAVSMPVQKSTPKNEVIIPTGVIHINGQQNFEQDFSVYSNMTNIQISGSFTSNESVYCVVMTEQQYTSWLQDPSLITNPNYYVWSSGNSTGDKISVNIPSTSAC